MISAFRVRPATSGRGLCLLKSKTLRLTFNFRIETEKEGKRKFNRRCDRTKIFNDGPNICSLKNWTLRTCWQET